MSMPYDVVMVIAMVIIVVQGCNFGAMTNNRLQGAISLKVPEHDEEYKQVHKIYLVAAVGVNRVMWTGGAYGPYP